MRSLLNSFRFAARGIIRTVKTERNFRIHLVCMAYMYAYLGLYDWFTLSREAWALLFAVNALVLAAEVFNTAIEALTDLATRRKHPLAAVAKDCAAGAVLVCAIGAVAVGLALLYQPAAFEQMYNYYRENPLMLLALAISLGISALFVFGFKKAKKKP
ncbi:MAG: diacylglycerol kinase family protein [Clostridium sp.]|nr:diacylglycerol kinase family protein [Clostridium sp.]